MPSPPQLVPHPVLPPNVVSNQVLLMLTQNVPHILPHLSMSRSLTPCCLRLEGRRTWGGRGRRARHAGQLSLWQPKGSPVGTFPGAPRGAVLCGSVIEIKIYHPGWSGSVHWTLDCGAQHHRFHSPVRAHAWATGRVPGRGSMRGNHTLIFLPLFLPPSPL